MGGWRTIDTAPKDGSAIELRGEEYGPVEMFWDKELVNPLVGNEPGIWVTPQRDMTWDDSRGFGPTHWRPARQMRRKGRA